MPAVSRRLTLACALVLLALNVWIAHRLFALEFTTLQSNETAFIAISRFFRDHWTDLRWFPWFDAGMPVANAYQPVLPALTSLLSGAGVPIGRAFHIVLALAYCLGPVTLFWFVWDWSQSLGMASLTGLLYSLISPAAMLFPSLRAGSGGFWTALRLFNLVYFGEDPHILALTLLPVALLFLRRAIVQRDRLSFIFAVLSCSAVALTNAFGVPVLALGVLCIVLAVGRGAGIALATGIAAWCLSAPWLPPSLIETIRRNAFSARGQYEGSLRAYIAVASVLLIFGIAWHATRRSGASFERFVWLFAVWMCAFPVVFFTSGVTLVPQSHRYQLELEMGLCLVLATLGIRLLRSGKLARNIGTAIIALLLIHQAREYRNVAHTLIHPFDIKKSVEYKATTWIDHNLPGMRTMVSGDAAWVFNVFSDNPQMSAGHEPTAPNFIQQIAVYQVYSGMNAGARDPDISIFWLKAFGNQAVTVPGPDSREVYKPFANPDKFAGVLPVLWRKDGDTIYGIPQRKHSLAHVIPADSVVKRRPVNGLDLEPARAYVAALDNPALPDAALTWQGQSKARIHARIETGQLLSVQENYDPAWNARVRSSSGSFMRRPATEDGLGLMVIDTGCTGDCDVELTYGTTAEIWLCGLLSGSASALLAALAISLIQKRVTTFPHHAVKLEG